MNPRRIGFTAAALLAAAGALAQDPLDGAGIATALTGATTQGINVYGNPYTVRFLADGSIEGVAGANDDYADAGTWWLESDALCRQWTVWLGGQANCFSVTLADGKISWRDVTDGSVVVEDYTAPQ